LKFEEIEKEYMEFLDKVYSDLLNTYPSIVIKAYLDENMWEEKVIEFGKNALDIDTEPEEDEDLYI